MSRTRTWTERMTFQRPFSLKAVGGSLPAGIYEIEFEGIEIRVNGRSVWQIAHCRIPIPSYMSVPGILGSAEVNHRELRQRLGEDQAATSDLNSD
jgi:hypothetical protein